MTVLRERTFVLPVRGCGGVGLEALGVVCLEALVVEGADGLAVPVGLAVAGLVAGSWPAGWS